MDIKYMKAFCCVALAAALGACTMKESEAPALSGPSEFGQSVTVSAVPDAIVQDGASQSVVTVTVLGPTGQPLSNVSLRADISVNGSLSDFGSLSARNLVTNGQGRATLVYTAPRLPSGAAYDPNAGVQIGVTPLGGDAANAVTRVTSVRLLPPGVVVPPSDLPLSFGQGSPTAGSAETALAFSVVPPAGFTIVRYTWNFGDGTSVSTTTPNASHTYHSSGTFVVSVVAEATGGRTGTASQTVAIGNSTAPTVDFVVSPTDPVPNQQVRFNASNSQPAPGRSIVSYSWDRGAGTTASGVTAQAVYPQIGTYTVTLTVTDDVGRRAVLSKTVSVKAPTTIR
jgi:hypothetical protein